MKKNKNKFHRIPKQSATALLVAAGLSLIGQAGYAQTALPPPPTEYKWWALNVGAYAAHNFKTWATSGRGVVESTTGAGVAIAVIDSGVIRHSEFTSTIVSNYLGSRVLQGRDYIFSGGDGTSDGNGHGTHVAGIAAAGLNGTETGIVGIAPDVWILPVRVLDNAGSGSWANVNNGVYWAVNTWVSGGTGQALFGGTPRVVVNMSLGGSSSSNQVFANIKTYGAVGVVAAGNDGRNISSTMFAYQAITNGAIGNSIIVGAVDSNNNIASFSNKPGSNLTLQNYFLVAPGASIYSTYNSSTSAYATMSGTSMATPVVSGAAAVVWGAWPYLSASAVVDSLLLSAKDLGVAGVDAVYGRGLLDLVKAMEPIGTYCYTGVNCPGDSGGNVDTGGGGSTKPGGSPKKKSLGTPAAAGVAVMESSARIVGYDSIGRHFFFPVSGALKAGGVNATYNMDGWMAKGQPVTQVTNTGAIRFSVQGDPNSGITGFSYRQDATDNSYVMAFKGSGVIPFGLAHTDFRANAFVSGDNMKIPYLGLMDSPVGMAYGRELGEGLSFRVGQLIGGSAANRTMIDTTAPYAPVVSSSAMLAEASKKIGPVQLIATFGSMREDGSFLGASSAGRTTEGSTTFSTISSVVNLGSGVSAMASFTRGQSRGLTSDGIADFNTRTEASSFGLLKNRAFAEKDQLALSFSMPSRVSRGGVTLNAGVDVNMETGAPIYGQIPIALTPQGRERRWELSWSTPLRSGNLALTALHRIEPNHDVTAKSENVLGARLIKSF